MNDNNLSPTAKRILYNLILSGKKSSKNNVEIGKIIDKNPVTVSKAISSLENNGYVTLNYYRKTRSIVICD